MDPRGLLKRKRLTMMSIGEIHPRDPLPRPVGMKHGAEKQKVFNEVRQVATLKPHNLLLGVYPS